LMTVFFAISRPVAVAGNVKDAGAASRDGRGLLWGAGRNATRTMVGLMTMNRGEATYGPRGQVECSAPDFLSTSSITPELSDCFASFIEAQFLAAWPLERQAWPRKKQPYRNQPRPRPPG
jgi:hypothetical protein